MRFSANTRLLLITWLFLGLGCRDKVDLQPAPVIPPARPACLIVKATYKTIYISGVKIDEERLEINGQSYHVYKRNETEYTYDKEGRLIREIFKTGRGSVDRQYAYTSKSVAIQTITTTDNVITENYRKSIVLNAQGYDDAYSYNEQGMLLTYTFASKAAVVKVEANNLIYHSEPYDVGRLISTYEFDRTRPGLPPVYQYRGVGDQNLRTSYLKSTQGVPYFNDGPAYRIDYQYVFDAQGRVKRQIELDTSYPHSLWPFYTNSGGIGVTDYEYECP